MKFFIAGTMAFLVAETFAGVLFFFLRRWAKAQEKHEAQHKLFGISPMLFKGILERFLIYVGLLSSFPQVLIVLGALKVATRIKYEDHISNDYFLIGNLLSITIAIATYDLFQWFLNLA